VIRGAGSAFIPGVSAQDVFDFVLDPAQYTRADTKMIWVTKLADTPDGMIAREDGRFLGRFPGSIVTRYRWTEPNRIDVTLELGVPADVHAWFDIEEREGGAYISHVETMSMPFPFARVFDRVAGPWFARAVHQEVQEIARLLSSGQRGRGRMAHSAPG